jgi:hypothetical protein
MRGKEKPVGIEKVAMEALRLSNADRATLANCLLLSLDEKSDPDAEKLWLKEISRRCELFRKGAYKERSAASVLKKAKALFR